MQVFGRLTLFQPGEGAGYAHHLGMHVYGYYLIQVQSQAYPVKPRNEEKIIGFLYSKLVMCNLRPQRIDSPQGLAM